MTELKATAIARANIALAKYWGKSDVTLNHKLLSALMLSTSELETMIAAASEAGALGAKVTGAGGGGCMIALVDSDAQREAVRAAMSALGKTVYDVESGP